MERNIFTILRAVFVIIIVSHHSYLLPVFIDQEFILTSMALAGFFIIAGYFAYSTLAKIQDYGKFAIQKLKRLYVPLVITIFLQFFLVKLIASQFYDPSSKFSLLREKMEIIDLGADFLLRSVYTFGHPWFVYSLLAIFLILPIVIEIGKKLNELLVLLLLLALSTVFQPFTTGSGEVAIHTAGYIFFVYLGYILGKWNAEKKVENILTIYKDTLLVVSVIFVAAILAVLNPADHSYPISFVFILASLAFVYATYWLFLKLVESVKSGTVFASILDKFYEVGEFSYIIYLFHLPYLSLGFILNHLAESYPDLVLPLYITETLAGIIIPIILFRLVERIASRMNFGASVLRLFKG